MADWLPLIVASIPALATFAITLWSTRGEMKDVRQLKAMNEVIAGLQDESAEKAAFVEARDGLLARTAARIAALPGRRQLLWQVIGVVVLPAAVVVAGVLIAVFAPDELAGQILNWLSAAVAVVGSLSVAFVARRMTRQAEKEVRELDAATQRNFEALAAVLRRSKSS